MERLQEVGHGMVRRGGEGAITVLIRCERHRLQLMKSEKAAAVVAVTCRVSLHQSAQHTWHGSVDSVEGIYNIVLRVFMSPLGDIYSFASWQNRHFGGVFWP